jgi:hypothetical protein
MSDLTLPIVALTTMAGYFFSKKPITREVRQQTNSVKKIEIPNGNNIYTSDIIANANKEILELSTENYAKAQTPSLTGVILPPLMGSYNNTVPIGTSNINQISSKDQSVIDNINKVSDIIMPKTTKSVEQRPMFRTETFLSNIQTTKEYDENTSLLTGKPLESKHNNMTPFFGSRVKQNIETFANQTILDLHTGNTSTFKHKQETAPLFEQQSENIYGTPLFTDNVSTERYIPSTFKQNDQAFRYEQVAAPIAGTINNNILPKFKSVDDLRTLDNPKQSFKGRTIAGQRGSVRGAQSQFDKHRPETFYKKDEGHLFKTTGAFIGNKKDEDFKTGFKATSRNEYTSEYYGILSSENPQTQRRTKLQDFEELDESHDKQFTVVQQAKRFNFENDYLRNFTGNKGSSDYGKSSLRSQETERETSQDTYLLNVNKPTIGVRNRFSDLPKETMKETTLIFDNSGNINSSFNKGRSSGLEYGITDYDSKPTHKESTLINDYKGPITNEKGMGYLVTNMEAKYTNKEEIISGERPAGPQYFRTMAGKVSHGDVKTTENMLLRERDNDRELQFSNTYSQPPIDKSLIGENTDIKCDSDKQVDRLIPELVNAQLANNPYSIYRKK